MLVVKHLPFLKSTTMPSPEAAALFTFHLVSACDSPCDSPRVVNFIRVCNPEVSIWTGRVSELFHVGRAQCQHAIELSN